MHTDHNTELVHAAHCGGGHHGTTCQPDSTHTVPWPCTSGAKLCHERHQCSGACAAHPPSTPSMPPPHMFLYPIFLSFLCILLCCGVSPSQTFLIYSPQVNESVVRRLFELVSLYRILDRQLMTLSFLARDGGGRAALDADVAVATASKRTTRARS
jgi:hypothetical protein